MPNASFVPEFLAVGLVFLLLGAVLWLFGRRGFLVSARPRGAARRIELLERLALGPQHSLHLIRYDGAALLVACSPAGCTLLQAGAAVRLPETTEQSR